MEPCSSPPWEPSQPSQWSTSPEHHQYSVAQLRGRLGVIGSSFSSKSYSTKSQVDSSNNENVDPNFEPNPKFESTDQFESNDPKRTNLHHQLVSILSAAFTEAIIDYDPGEPTLLRKHGDSLVLGTPHKDLVLSNEQKYVLDIVVRQRMNVFFTGAAGTGKSVLLRRIIADLRKFHGSGVFVTASTGIAACNIGGITLHSFAGIGLGKEDVDMLFRRIKRNRRALNRWRSAKVLIIDEVSMITGELIDKLDALAKLIRRNHRAFGGIQIVLTGDFFQLPPVAKNDPSEQEQNNFAFDAECWTCLVERTLLLTQVFRQKDPRFANMLNEMRHGHLSPETISTFQALHRPLAVPDGITPTRLFSTRVEVERSNTAALARLPHEAHVFQADDKYYVNEEQVRRMGLNLDNLIAPSSIELKVGAQVMMIKNIDDTLVNGSLGKVVGFMADSLFCQLPQHIKADLKHGFDSATFEQEFPELLRGLCNRDLERLASYTDARKRMRMQELHSAAAASNTQVYPLVRFVSPSGTFRELLVTPETWEFENPEALNPAVSQPLASRTQLPLILAWAMSIHKSQGQTLDYVHVNLNTVFERGQAYVAISRATSMEGIQVIGFNPSKVRSNSRVVEFYNNLEKFEPRESLWERFKHPAGEATMPLEPGISAVELDPIDLESDPLDPVVIEETLDCEFESEEEFNPRTNRFTKMCYDSDG